MVRPTSGRTDFSGPEWIDSNRLLGAQSRTKGHLYSLLDTASRAWTTLPMALKYLPSFSSFSEGSFVIEVKFPCGANVESEL